jgi:hypothetical protein
MLVYLQSKMNAPHPTFGHPLPARRGEGWGEERLTAFENTSVLTTSFLNEK